MSEAPVTTGQKRINWEDFNYPPGCKLVHYDLSELNELRSYVIRRPYWSTYGMGVSFLLNSLSTIVLVAGQVADPVLLTFALTYPFIWFVLGGWSFYGAYKGVATGMDNLTKRYLIIQGIMILYSFSVGIAAGQWYPSNGWAQFSTPLYALAGIVDELNGSSYQGFWTAMIVIESLLWWANCGLACYAWYMIYVFRRDGPQAFSSKFKGAAGRALESNI